MHKTEGDLVLKQLQGAGRPASHPITAGTWQYSEERALYSVDVTEELLTEHFPSAHPGLLASATCMVAQMLARYQLEVFVSISCAQTTRT